MSQGVSIRPIQTDEIDQLIKISKQCLHQTSSPRRALEDVNTCIQRVYTREKLLPELKTITSKMFFVFIDS